LIQADGDGLRSSDLQCRDLEVGEPIRIEGNPTIMEFVSATGKIAGVGRKLGHWESVQVVDITIVPGQSGGPVYDAGGKLVGITVGVATMGNGWSVSLTGFGFITPGSAICPLLART
jgi:S1-C subfamily serine protease